MTEPLVVTEQVGSVRKLSLNRPSHRNAQSQQLLDELDQAFQLALEHDDTRVVILAGIGDHFSAGHDLKQAQESRAAFTVEERWAYESRRYYDYCLRIWDFPKPTIAQVQGACISGGFMVANMCDLIVASEDAFFSDPVTLTMGTAATEVLIHPWVLGLRAAKELLFTGQRLTAQRAHEIGLVNQVCTRPTLDQTSLDLATRISKAPAFALQILKKSLNRSVECQGFRQALSAHFDLHQLSHTSEAFKELVRAGISTAIQKGNHASTAS